MENVEIKEWTGITFVANCKVDFGDNKNVLYPSYILSNKGEFLSVYVGKPLMNGKISRELFTKGYYGVYIDSRDFDEIVDLKKFVLIHDQILVLDDEKREKMVVDIEKVLKTDDNNNMSNFWLIAERDFKK